MKDFDRVGSIRFLKIDRLNFSFSILRKHSIYEVDNGRKVQRYRPTYQGILRQIRKGQLIHANLTKAS